MAAVFLAKMTNSPILIVAFAFVMFALSQSSRAGRLGERLPKLALFSATTALPVLAWLGWNAWMVGDVTGHSQVAGGWTRKPLLEIFDHPFFTAEGATFFTRELITSYWRGEFFWKNERLTSSGMDLFYLVTTILFIIAGVVRIVGFSGSDDVNRRLTDRSAALSLALGVASLIFVSIGYDFGNWAYPSRESPFLWSGRLISGSLVPFLLLYCSGLEFLLSRWADRRLTLAVISGIAIAILGSEISLSWSVFSSPYNWFHL